MFRSWLARTMTVVSLSCVSLIAEATEPRVYVNARVYTMNPEQPRAEAFAINEGGKLVAVGTNEEVLNRYSEGEDLNGAMVLPGFHDAHVHAVEAGTYGAFCFLTQHGRVRTYRNEILECAKSQADWPWVLAAGANIPNLVSQIGDPLEFADKLVPDKPLLVVDDLGHGAWGNSLAFAESGLDKLEQDPSGGMLMRHKGGRLNGVVLEATAQVLIDAARLPDGWQRSQDFGLNYALGEFARHGITSVSDAGGYWPRDHVSVWYQAAEAGELTVRTSNALYVYPHLNPDEQIRELIELYDDDANDGVRFNQVKIYVDGILSQTSGLLLRAYDGAIDLPLKERNGFRYFQTESLFKYASELSAAGFQLHFHTTGDLGARLALDAIEQSSPKSGPHRITHLYLVDPKDFPRFKQLNVVADFQLPPSVTESDYAQWMKMLLGDRSEHLMPLRSLSDSGAQVVISSDWDADELSPLIKLRSALSWPEGPRDLQNALEMMTINPARLLKQDHLTGSIEVGKAADLVILDQDLFELSVEEFSEVKVLGTIFAGEFVYESERD